MRTLKLALPLLGAMLLAIGLVSILIPKDARVKQSMHIEAPPQEVYVRVRYFKHFEKWSPWEARYPQMSSAIEGTDGEVGAVYYWDSDKAIGQGRQEIVSITPQRIEWQYTFKKPWETTAESYFEITPDGKGTQVVWGVILHMPFPWNITGFFLDIEGDIEKDYNKGLNRLKRLCEEGEGALQSD